MKILIMLLAVISSSTLFAKEPAYCEPTNFLKRELRSDTTGLKGARVFKIGKLTIAGLGVGDSDSRYVERLALTYSRAGSSQKFCTWYLNKGNIAAEQTFNHRYVPSPVSDSNKTSKKYYEVLQKDFDQDSDLIARCVAEQRYLALGCNGMRHRGPSVFAMVLAFSGCTPEHSVAIANQLWGRNGVSDETRLELARVATQMAQSRPSSASKLASVMSAQ